MQKGKKVFLEYDVQKYDRYGRTLACVYLEDRTFLNAHLLEMGLARLATYPPNARYVEGITKIPYKSKEIGYNGQPFNIK
ncbi:thermonuclease family protein [Algoriphagus sp. Y33]|uniref:thermonuclease family protein n=1 Tax=Algoriphagus sp. Y33 TaxID=2772483 RepID=UPI001CE03C52|nr:MULTISPECIES: thermonuclease family protein [unclassified Algoriphagus]